MNDEGVHGTPEAIGGVTHRKSPGGKVKGRYSRVTSTLVEFLCIQYLYNGFLSARLFL